MPFSIYTVRLLGLAQTVHRWLHILCGLDRVNRERIADYAEAISATLSRAALAMSQVEEDQNDETSRAAALRELGRIAGYVETMVGVLEHHLDGRKLAGVKRRLDLLDAEKLALALTVDRVHAGPPSAHRLLVVEGYFRALADGLRT